MQMQWSNEMLTVIHETQTFNSLSGSMDIDVHGEITATGEWWLHTAVGVLAMLPGKLDPEGTGHLLAPANAEPDMIGTLVATMLKEISPSQGY